MAVICMTFTLRERVDRTGVSIENRFIKRVMDHRVNVKTIIKIVNHSPIDDEQRNLCFV